MATNAKAELVRIVRYIENHHFEFRDKKGNVTTAHDDEAFEVEFKRNGVVNSRIFLASMALSLWPEAESAFEHVRQATLEEKKRKIEEETTKKRKAEEQEEIAKRQKLLPPPTRETFGSPRPDPTLL